MQIQKILKSILQLDILLIPNKSSIYYLNMEKLDII